MAPTTSESGEFELWLHSVAGATRYPPAPSLAGPVAERLAMAGPPRAWWGWTVPGQRAPRAVARPVAAGLLVAIMALALTLAFSSSTRSAFAKFFGLQRIEVVPAEGTPPTSGIAPYGFESVAGLTTLEEARKRAAFLVMVPTARLRFGDPDAVYFQDLAPGQQVVLVYGSRPEFGFVAENGKPLFTLFQIQTEGVFQKQVFPETLIEEFEFAGIRMLWFEGAAHVLKYRSPDGIERVELDRVVDLNTLAWEIGDMTYRLETSLGRDDAVKLAFVFPITEAAGESSAGTPAPPSGTEQEAHPDALALAGLASEVVQWVRDNVAQKAGLRQLDISDGTWRYIFRLADATVPVAVTVLMVSPGDPPERWEIHTSPGGTGKFEPDGPAIDLGALRVGPKAVEMIAGDFEGGYELTFISLQAGDDGVPFWFLSCINAYGWCGVVDGESGEFTPPVIGPGGPPPPVRVPVTATPAP